MTSYTWTRLLPMACTRECLEALARSDLLTDSSLVVAEHHHKNDLQENYDKLALKSERKLGDSCLSYYQLAVGSVES